MIDALQYLNQAMTFLSVSAFFALLAGGIVGGAWNLRGYVRRDGWRSTMLGIGKALTVVFVMMSPLLIIMVVENLSN